MAHQGHDDPCHPSTTSEESGIRDEDVVRAQALLHRPTAVHLQGLGRILHSETHNPFRPPRKTERIAPDHSVEQPGAQPPGSRLAALIDSSGCWALGGAGLLTLSDVISEGPDRVHDGVCGIVQHLQFAVKRIGDGVAAIVHQ